MVEQVKKRNGEIVIFDAKKIREAIHKANIAVADEKIPAKSLRELTDKVVGSLPAGQVPTVEQIQDKVEEILIGADYAKTAKAYILYRAEHAKIRQSEADLMDIYKELTFAYAKDADIKRENANIDADTAMGTMLKYGSEGSKYFIDNYILPKDIAAAHINGDIHIHDKDFYMLTETCCQIDLLKLFHNGFSTGHGTLREPNSIIPPWLASPSRPTRTRCTAARACPTSIIPWRRVWRKPLSRNISVPWLPISISGSACPCPTPRRSRTGYGRTSP